MKKLTLFIAITFFALMAKAQDISFAQTQKYINDKATGITLNLHEGNYIYHHIINKIDIKQNGEIVIDIKKDIENPKFNIFDLPEIETNISTTDYSKSLWITGIQNSLSIEFATAAEAERVGKAFKNLRKVCIQEDDPFDTDRKKNKRYDDVLEKIIAVHNKSNHKSRWISRLVVRDVVLDVKWEGGGGFSFRIDGLKPMSVRKNETNPLSIHYEILNSDGITKLLVNKEIDAFELKKLLEQLVDLVETQE